MKNIILLLITLSIASCEQEQNNDISITPLLPPNTITEKTVTDTIVDNVTEIEPATFRDNVIQTGNTTPNDLLKFAKTLQGIPYKYGSINPAEGFDCSGFITYVFSHFNISVPRSSIDFTNVERAINLIESKPGDIVLYTGTDSTIKTVGHMGIITTNHNGQIEFIHSTSGKADGVTITPLNDYYMSRFVKVIRIFKQNDQQ